MGRRGKKEEIEGGGTKMEGEGKVDGGGRGRGRMRKVREGGGREEDGGEISFTSCHGKTPYDDALSSRPPPRHAITVQPLASSPP